ncbi:MAG: hypothetical protein ACREJB_05050 [Planctomycetaceae bacterium]
MRKQHAMNVRSWVIRALCAGGAVAALLGFASSADAQNPAITRIEEDWVIQIGTPDPSTDSPQIIVSTSPTGSLGGHHTVFEINHHTLPDYCAGGLALQRWHGNYCWSHEHFPGSCNSLSTAGETITFTMKLSVANGYLDWDVDNASSTTWGNFGNDGHLKLTTSTSLTDLGLYSPDASKANSHVSYASHQVQKLAIKEVRYYSGSTLVNTDTTERVVHQYTN